MKKGNTLQVNFFTTPRRLTEEKICSSILEHDTKIDLNGQLHAPAAFTPEKNPGFLWIGG
jgi:hypothetical protein